MKKNFIIILLLVLSILIGCSISEVVTIKADSTRIEIDGMGNVNIEITKNGQRVEIQVPLTQQEKEALNIREESVIFSNVNIDQSFIGELEKNANSGIGSSFSQEELSVIHSGIDKISAEINPTNYGILVNASISSGHGGTHLVFQDVIVAVIRTPDGGLIIIKDTDGDGVPDSYEVYDKNGNLVGSGELGDIAALLIQILINLLGG